MALEQKKHLLTYADYQALPDDGKRYELVDGVIYVTAAPTPWHQRLADRICAEVLFYLKTHPVGEVYSAPLDTILNPEESTRVWQPDVVYISNERRSIITDQNIQGAPDLVVEILSPGSHARDLGSKKRAYEESGVREYWVVWQDLPRVEVYRLVARAGEASEAGRYGDPHLVEAGGTVTTDLLPGFTLELEGLYAGMPAAEE